MVSPVVSFHDVIESLEQYRGLEQSTLGENLRRFQEARGLHESLLAQQLDIQTAAQVALDQQELIRNAIGEETAAAAMDLAEQHVEASLDASRVAEITEQLDRDYLVRTLAHAQELLADNAVADALARQADVEAWIRSAEDALAAYPQPDSGELVEEPTMGPPDWMRELSREERVALMQLLVLYVETIFSCYGVGIALADGEMSAADMQAVGQVLITALHWTVYLLNRGDD